MIVVVGVRFHRFWLAVDALGGALRVSFETIHITVVAQRN